MKPYAPLGILYLCSHLRNQGFDVDVFDTTFSSKAALFQHLRTEAPSVLGIYANLMTRGNAVEIMSVARAAGWRVIVGRAGTGSLRAGILGIWRGVCRPSAKGEATHAGVAHCLQAKSRQDRRRLEIENCWGSLPG